MYENLLLRFLWYMKTETHSGATNMTTSSTQTQAAFIQTLKKELEKLGMSDVICGETNGSVIATLPSNVEEDVRSIGFIAHMDTVDFNAANVSSQIVENYDGESTIPLDKEGKFTLNVEDPPNLKNYRGETLITTDDTTLLGADNRSGIAEMTTAMEYLINHPEIKYGIIRVAFGPDEEVGMGVDKSDVVQFNVDFAYTMGGGSVGESQFETFNVVQVEITVQGKNVHPGIVKDTMINALQLGIDFHNTLPADEVPERTAGEEGFYHLAAPAGMPGEATMTYIIRDHNRKTFEACKAEIREVQQTLNAPFDEKRIKADLFDQYYNMRGVIEKDMFIVETTKQVTEELSVQPITEPVRGGTDSSKISYLRIPTPNILVGDRDMRNRFEPVPLQAMGKTTNMIIKVAGLNAK